ncbi:MAG: sodium:proton antiporter [Desulfurococcaceae archaeon]
MRSSIVLNPYELIYMITLITGFITIVLALLYYALKSKEARVTTVYLSGESESVIAWITPSIASLYWGFMKKFARSIYRVLVEKIHTGSLHDWFKFISSWFSILLITAIIVFILTLLVR